jgi:hypothetical protein
VPAIPRGMSILHPLSDHHHDFVITAMVAPAIPRGMSTLHPDLARLERRRLVLGITLEQWAKAAGINVGFFRDIRRKGIRPRPASLARLARGLEELAGASRARPPVLIAAFVRAAEVVITREIGGDTHLIADLAIARHKREHEPRQVARARLRRVAIYLTAIELEISNVELARALRTSRQNIAQARLAVEKLRERACIDRLLEQCRTLLRA